VHPEGSLYFYNAAKVNQEQRAHVRLCTDLLTAVQRMLNGCVSVREQCADRD